MASTVATPRQAELGAEILVIEDDLGMQDTIRWALEDEGLSVATATDGWQGLHLALLRRPELVIVDLNLPRLDGGDVVDGLRIAQETAIPVLLVSGDRRLAERARELGAFAYLCKPFNVANLVDAVRRGLNRSSSELRRDESHPLLATR